MNFFFHPFIADQDHEVVHVVHALVSVLAQGTGDHGLEVIDVDHGHDLALEGVLDPEIVVEDPDHDEEARPEVDIVHVQEIDVQDQSDLGQDQKTAENARLLGKIFFYVFKFS